MPVPTIRIDDEVYAHLQRDAEPFVDTPNSVLRRILGLSERDAEIVKMPDGVTTTSPAKRTASSSAPKGRARKSSKRRSKDSRAPVGSLLSEHEYDVPLLEALVELGGSGTYRDVLDAIRPRLEGKLTELDKSNLPSGPIRWENRLQFVRLRLIKEGLVSNESPRGVWAISDAGREHLTKNAGGVA